MHESPPLLRRFGFLLGLVLCAVLLALAPPAGMSPAAWRVAAVASLMATWWVTEAIPIAASALVPLVLFPVLGVATMSATAAPYANPVIFLFLGGFLLALATQRVGLHRRLALAIVGAVGTRPDRLVLGFVVATALISMWVSNTATVVMILPLATPVLELLRAGDDGVDGAASHHFEVALLLGIAYAASIGGLGTLVGTPPNALLAGFMAETHDVRIGFGRWMLLGVPIVAIGIPIAWLLLTRVAFRVDRRPAPNVAALVAEQRRGLGAATRGEWIVGSVVAAAALCWTALPLIEQHVPGLTEPAVGVAAALLLFIIPAGRRPALDATSLEEVPWGVLLLFGGGLSLAAAIQDSGLAGYIGEALSALGTLPLLPIILMITTVVVFLSEFTSNTATAAVFIPLSSALAIGIGVDPLVLVVPAALAASIGFMMPVGTPPNALVFGTGRIRMGEMVRAGFVLNVAMILVVAVAGYCLAGVVVAEP